MRIDQAGDNCHVKDAVVIDTDVHVLVHQVCDVDVDQAGHIIDIIMVTAMTPTTMVMMMMMIIRTLMSDTVFFNQYIFKYCDNNAVSDDDDVDWR